MHADDAEDPSLASYQDHPRQRIMTQRGDVVIVAFPYVSGGGGNNRPALVIQADRNNQRLANTIVAMITGINRLGSDGANASLDRSHDLGGKRIWPRLHFCHQMTRTSIRSASMTSFARSGACRPR